MVVARGQGKGRMGNFCLTGTRFQFHKMKRALEMDGGDHTTMYLMSLTYALKIVKIVNCMLCTF